VPHVNGIERTEEKTNFHYPTPKSPNGAFWFKATHRNLQIITSLIRQAVGSEKNFRYQKSPLGNLGVFLHP
jgi:hypothetical protein